MTAKHVRVDRGVEERPPLGWARRLCSGLNRRAGAGPLMLLVAGLFAGSTLISLTVLWFVVRAIQWLLSG